MNGMIESEPQHRFTGHPNVLALGQHFRCATGSRAAHRANRSTFAAAGYGANDRPQDRSAAYHFSGTLILADAARAFFIDVGSIDKITAPVHTYRFEVQSDVRSSRRASIVDALYDQA